MPIFPKQLPLALYIHIPWCVRKCPYCDFNSHEAKGSLPEELYVHGLMQELDSHLEKLAGRSLVSIFFGGGTPSLFSAQMIGRILEGVNERIPLSSDIEITLEANPGTIDHVRFKDFRLAGINRLSLGIQSLQDEKLKTLGRIHDRANALQAVEIAKAAGFTNFNLDIMYGLPHQTLEEACDDIRTALACEPTHFSWYQLTIEPNTYFHHHTPPLPTDDRLWDMQLAGQALIKEFGFEQYEVSAYSLPGKTCQHNKNYWEFGDYLGIGAGAHSKLTNITTGEVIRFSQVKNPRDYLEVTKRQNQALRVVIEKELMFEFMLNALRLTNGVPADLFTQRTGIPLKQIESILSNAKKRGLLVQDEKIICPTELGKQFLNNLTELFL